MTRGAGPKAHAAARAVGIAAGLLAALPASAQGGIDAPALRRFGGTYAVTCTDPAAARLHITADALRVEQGGQRMTGRKPTSAYSYFGNSPAPKNFQLALIGEVRGGPQLIFMAYADAGGPYLLLDGDPKVTAALGRRLMAATYRRCRPPAEAVAGPALPAPAPAPALPAGAGDVPDLSALISDPTFKRVYQRAIGTKASERWLTRFDGPAAPTRSQTVDHVPYVVVAICKAHDCYDHNAVFLYSASLQRVHGLIQRNGVKTLVGAPGPALAAPLERLWQAEWRQK